MNCPAPLSNVMMVPRLRVVSHQLDITVNNIATRMNCSGALTNIMEVLSVRRLAISRIPERPILLAQISTEHN
jgi:hypothetical protein